MDYELERETAVENLKILINQLRNGEITDEIEELCDAIGCSDGQDWEDQNFAERLVDLIERPACSCCPSCGAEIIDEH